ncbi:MAG: AMP-dependent synthetase/ligase [Bifidobacteriaceae bacterium]|jgi:long-chain acyl-CoA synthetase|nr:AMP-dependent synthetase/ligase [Bifidobacteriaceae bacterium]
MKETEQKIENVKLKKTVNTFAILEERAARDPDGSLFEYYKNGKWEKVTAAQFLNQVKAVGKGLIAKGVKVGDSIAIISKTRYEWSLFDFAIWATGALPIPIYETDSAEQIKYIFEDASVKFAVVEDDDIYSRCPKRVGSKAIEIWRIDHNAHGMLEAFGESVSDAEVESRCKIKKGEDIATIVYTSGSTALPKGVELTHRVLCACVYNGCKGVPEILLRENARILLFLPLAHVLARYLELAAIAGTTTIGMARSIKTLLDDLRQIKPTYLLAVPRIFEKVYNASSHRASKGLKAKIFANASKTARAYSEALSNGEKISRSLKFKHELFDKLVYSQIRAVLGGNLEYCVSGGAPLDISLVHFFTGAGVPVFEGYGMTETAAPACVNRLEALRLGTVGKPLPGVEAKVSADGELLLRGESVDAKYHNLEELTKEINKGGWLHTGDLAYIDYEGFVTITGRKKDIIVTAGGKNVSPSALEDGVRVNPIISQCVVIGDKRPFVSALITLDADELKIWLDESGLDSQMFMKEASVNPAVLAEVQKIVDDVNKLFSRAESIRKFIVLENDFSEANEMLTASQKVKKPKVLEIYNELINKKIYL